MNIESSLLGIKKHISKVSISESLLGFVIFLDLILLFSSIIAESYYNLVTVGTGFDGWCDKNVFGIGVHCFSDYTLTDLIVNEQNPWNSQYISPQNYPAAALLITLLFSKLGTALSSPQIGLVLYLISMSLCLLLPSIWATKGKKPYLKLLVVSVTGIASVPAIMALDRGNSVGFVVPALLLILIGIENRNTTYFVTGIMVASIVKPQFAFLLILPFVLARWKVLYISLMGVIVVQIVPFVLWPSNFPATIQQAVQNTLSYGGLPDFKTHFPTNVSVASSLFELTSLANPSNYENEIPQFIQQHPSQITFVIVVIFYLWSFIVRKYLPTIFVSIYTFVFASTLATVSWSYYLVFAIPVAALILRDPANSEIGNKSSFQGVADRISNHPVAYKLSFLFLLPAVSFTLSKFIIPNYTPNSDPYPFSSVELSTSLWIISGFSTLIIYTLVKIRTPRRTILKIYANSDHAI